MKKFAYYLPQYHCIPENDLWWGKGFTEWTNVRKAVPLFKNHLQPKVPLDEKYYSLDDVNTLYWQADLAKKYDIDGMIFYHYYFCGRKLLEKPAELLLKSPDIPMKFFFCWANHSWYRSWEGSKELLVEQTYGNKDDWEDHFSYLLPFFKDSRYEKKDNKPLLMFFNCSFPDKNAIIDYFDKRCKEEGFSGICSIERISTYNCDEIRLAQEKSNDHTEYYYVREPEVSGSYYLRSFNNLILNLKVKIKSYFPKVEYRKILKYDGDELFHKMIEHSIPDSKVVRGLFFEWDNTPRHGKRGYVITPPSKDSFMKYMNSIKESDYVFINAWNEWCEGMMLEPTEVNGYKYLEWIKEWSEKNEDRPNWI